jgi:fibronectin-binding autotransporter adhesin
MRSVLFAILTILAVPAVATAQISVVDSQGYALALTSSRTTEGITISSGADVLVVDLSVYGNTSWTGVGLSLSGTAMTQATAEIPSSGIKTDTAIYYLDNPGSGSFTLSGSFNNSTATILDYYTLSGVNTGIAPIVGSTNVTGSATTASLVISTSTNAFCAINQSVYKGATAYSYNASYPLTYPAALAGGSVGNLSAGDGYIQELGGGTNSISATVNANHGANHAISVVAFTTSPISVPAQWIGGSGNWSAGGNWSTGIVPTNSIPGAKFAQSGTASETITLDGAVQLGTLQIGGSNTNGNGTVSYSITGANTITLSNSASGLLVYSGITDTQMISSNLSGISGVTLMGNDLGGGQLILSGSNDYSGGTVVEAGTLIVNTSSALPDGTSLTVGSGGTFIFDPSVSGAPAMVESAARVESVPEPGTLVLLTVAIAILAWRRYGW